MTISEALISLNSFPIPTSLIEKIGIERELTISDDYTIDISEEKAFKLATADVYMWLYSQPSITEQDVGVNQILAVKKGLLDFANAIYLEYDDAKYTGKGTYGFIGTSF